jgi:hypothetical protein
MNTAAGSPETTPTTSQPIESQPIGNPHSESRPTESWITPAVGTLSLPGLERVYDTLAQAIDQAGPDKTELFLVKLALLNAHALGDSEQFSRHVHSALQDL